MRDGRQETSTARMRRASTPLCSLTPAASPTTWIGTSTGDLLVHPHRLEVDVDEGVAHRVVLELAHDGGPGLGIAGQADVHEHAARIMAVEGAMHVCRLYGERTGSLPPP